MSVWDLISLSVSVSPLGSEAHHRPVRGSERWTQPHLPTGGAVRSHTGKKTHTHTHTHTHNHTRTTTHTHTHTLTHAHAHTHTHTHIHTHPVELIILLSYLLSNQCSASRVC